MAAAGGIAVSRWCRGDALWDVVISTMPISGADEAVFQIANATVTMQADYLSDQLVKRAGQLSSFTQFSNGTRSMQIWVDADACPAEAKEVLYKVARRLQISITLVANQMMRIPQSSLIQFELVRAGANMADQRIVELAQPGDLVITADIPLSADAVAKGATVLDPRGNVLTNDNVGARLAERNLLDELRGGGLETGGPAPYSPKNKQDFANQLDRLLTRLLRK